MKTNGSAETYELCYEPGPKSSLDSLSFSKCTLFNESSNSKLLKKNQIILKTMKTYLLKIFKALRQYGYICLM